MLSHMRGFLIKLPIFNPNMVDYLIAFFSLLLNIKQNEACIIHMQSENTLLVTVNAFLAYDLQSYLIKFGDACLALSEFDFSNNEEG